MIGILAEKPSAAQNFAKALGGMNGTYNGEPYIIVASHGHLYEFKKPDEQVPKALVPKFKSWDLSLLPWDETAFLWEREKKPIKKGMSDATTTIKAGLSKCDEIVIATDVDPSGEGELLAWEILDELRLRPKKFSRMYFVDEAPRSIQTAFVQRKVIPSMMADSDYLKALYRSKFDFLTMQFTRIARQCSDGVSILRQGRLKSAMVLLVGDGLAAVAGYKKIPFYQNRFRDENGICYVNSEEPMFPDKSQVPMTYQTSGVVVDSKTMKSTPPPKMLDLAALSAILAGRGFKADDVLSTYQRMYEAQIVSYPRTEDKYITPEQFQELLPFVDQIANVVNVDSSLLTRRSPRSTHVKTGCSHGANRPGVNVPTSLASLSSYGACASHIYDILAHNYLATLAEDYEYESQKGHVASYPAFTGSASVPRLSGWKAVFSDIDDDQDESTKSLGTTAAPYIHEGFPPKPPTPTMAWLMKQLEKHDVGTGATRTKTYAELTSESKLVKFPLMRDVKGKVTLTDYGTMSYRLLPGTHIGDLSLTEEVQNNMRAVAAGTVQMDVCLAKVRDYVRDDIITMTANGAKMRKELGKTMAAGTDKEYYEGVWNGAPVKFNRVYCGHRFTDGECRQLADGDEIKVLGLVSKSKTTYGVTGKLSRQTFNGHDFVGFERTGFASSGMPSTWCKHKFTDDEKTMLEDGRAVQITDAVSSKTGKTFSCKLTYSLGDDGEMHLVPSFDR